jgi:DNA-binding NarL/FixJ family response regulator
MSVNVAASASKPREILLVDDHPLVLDGLTKLIDQESDLHVCDRAEDVGEAFRKIAAEEPDMVVVDLSLRTGSGLELIKQLQGLPRPPRVLVLSMHDEVFYAERALRAGALGYVMKKETSGKLLHAIRQVLGGRLSVSDSLAEALAKKFAGVSGPLPASSVAQLGDRELHVFRLIGQGYETREIAEELGISPKTVQAHCEHIKTKLGIANASMLIREAVLWLETNGRSAIPPAKAP